MTSGVTTLISMFIRILPRTLELPFQILTRAPNETEHSYESRALEINLGSQHRDFAVGGQALQDETRNGKDRYVSHDMKIEKLAERSGLLFRFRDNSDDTFNAHKIAFVGKCKVL